ncbi:MAG: hypothetical protein LH616_06245 [Ilumatobacteraceae bacterium]|nr:hypothetical protein [Ilumatobacteraceae bacterium]
MRIQAAVLAISSMLVFVSCSDDDSTVTTQPAVATVAPATVCAADVDDEVKTVTIEIDDVSDGSGRFGLRMPNPLPAGPIRLLLKTAADNPEPVTVTVTGGDATVFEFVRVQPGVECATVLELVAGDYTATFGDSSKTFTVTAAS